MGDAAAKEVMAAAPDARGGLMAAFEKEVEAMDQESVAADMAGTYVKIMKKVIEKGADSSSFLIDVGEDCTELDVKKIISKQAGIPVEMQCLKCGGANGGFQLRNGATLKECGIQLGDTASTITLITTE